MQQLLDTSVQHDTSPQHHVLELPDPTLAGLASAEVFHVIRSQCEELVSLLKAVPTDLVSSSDITEYMNPKRII